MSRRRINEAAQIDIGSAYSLMRTQIGLVLTFLQSTLQQTTFCVLSGSAFPWIPWPSYALLPGPWPSYQAWPFSGSASLPAHPELASCQLLRLPAHWQALAFLYGRRNAGTALQVASGTVRWIKGMLGPLFFPSPNTKATKPHTFKQGPVNQKSSCF